MISERQKLILRGAVQEYIESAIPVGSQLLFEKYDFGVSPATLRSECAALEEAGCLFHPYTSAGRVPTDKGYRIFVDGLVRRDFGENKKTREAFQKLRSVAEEEYALFSKIARVLSDLSGAAVFSGPRNGKAFFRSGIHEVLSQPESEDSAFRIQFGDVVDSLEEYWEYFSDAIGKERPLVFIGNENPVAAARGFSMMLSSATTQAGDAVVVIFGPKRMDYQRNLNLLDMLADLLK